MLIKFPATIITASLAIVFLSILSTSVKAATTGALNLAPAATASTSFVSGHESLPAIQDGVSPRASRDHSHGCYGNWPQRGTQWVQYNWSHPVSINGAAVYWWDDHQGVHLPVSASQNLNKPIRSPSLSAKWSPKLLDGVVSLRGKSADGSPLVAVPNYARLNRGGDRWCG